MSTKKKKARTRKLQNIVMLPALIAGIGVIYIEFMIGMIKSAKNDFTTDTNK